MSFNPEQTVAKTVALIPAVGGGTFFVLDAITLATKKNIPLFSWVLNNEMPTLGDFAIDLAVCAFGVYQFIRASKRR